MPRSSSALAGMLLAQPVQRGRTFGQRLVIAVARRRALAGQGQIEIDGKGSGLRAWGALYQRGFD